MGFSKSVKDKMLVASARHCCVCHRYKGVKVEVHHIMQEANSGPNTFENAIALCFDCHADAGHYNLRHPRGTKFSPEELNKARESWLQAVSENRINQPNLPDNLLCRYYVCKNFEILSEISKLDFSRFPAENVRLHKNHIFSSLVDIIRRHPGKDRDGTVYGRSFESEEEYLKLYRHPKDLADEKGYFPYYCGERNPTQEDLKDLSKSDGVANAMLEFGMPAAEAVAVVGCYEDACHGIELFEEYLLRNLWCVFLAIENVSTEPVTLDYLVGNVSTTQGFGILDVTTGLEEKRLPAAPIKTGHTVIVPVAVVLPSLDPFNIEYLSSVYPEGRGEYYLSISHCSIDSGSTKNFLTFGGIILPQLVVYTKSGEQAEQPVHEFDLSNFYEIDMAWGAGSCPHLFYKSERLSYVRELLAQCENTIGIDEITVPKGVTKIVIAELEDEISEFVSIKVNGIKLASNLRLEKGQTLDFSVLPGDRIKIIGQYIPILYARHDLPAGRIRNALIHRFLTSNV